MEPSTSCRKYTSLGLSSALLALMPSVRPNDLLPVEHEVVTCRPRKYVTAGTWPVYNRPTPAVAEAVPACRPARGFEVCDHAGGEEHLEADGRRVHGR